MTLIKTSLLNAIAVVIKILTLLGLNKVLAIYVGPSGYAAIGQFQNAVQMITTFASGAINTGVTKYTSEYYEDEEKQRTIWRTAGSIAFIGTFVISLLVIIFSKFLAKLFLKDESYSGVFLWFAVSLIFFIFNALLLAILNGKKEINRYIIASISGSLFSLTVTSLLVIKFGLYGALVALALYQSLSFCITLLLCFKTKWFKFSYLYGRIDKCAAKNLAKYTAMALTSAACVPVSHILIRNHVGETLGWEAAGYWEAMWRLSAAYLMFVTSTLSVYYLPRLSELKDTSKIKNEILQGYKIILPMTVLFSFIIYLLREYIIRVLFTVDFIGMEVLFAWQLVGDTLKIGSWILAYIMLGKAMVKLFIFSEIIFSLTFYILTILFTDIFNLEGVALAYAVSYFIYWVLMAIFIGYELKKKYS